MKKLSLILALVFICSFARASYILIPMDDAQINHLKAYGITYWILSHDIDVDWLLNYRGGSFAVKHLKAFESECMIRGVSYEIIADVQYNAILAEISNPEVNMDVMKLEKHPKIAVYAPKTIDPWDDAVTLVLTYAEIPYDIIYDDEVISGVLPKYDWLHLHHEDFTGQYGKFYGSYRNAPWYIRKVESQEAIARRHGFGKVSELKLAVASKIRDYVAGGGFMFAMCSATDSYDIALAAQGVDICANMFDGDAADPQAQGKLDFSNSIAFENFTLRNNPYEYEFSNIDATKSRSVSPSVDFFTLFEFSAKWDPVPTMLTQNHQRVIKGFMGQTTAFIKPVIKPTIIILGENKSANEARYIHSEYGYGFFTFYGGHDPEDYQHFVGDPPTDLNLHPTSPGYRLILNNVLFPAARKKDRKT
ncbi:MAG: asparagine synthetase B [Bacteroidetes bacterium]|nr:asparagine synthetase B [Bacteroidota bacterium]